MPVTPVPLRSVSYRSPAADAAETLVAVARLMKSDAGAYMIGRLRFECGSSPSAVDHFDAGVLLSEDFRAAVASFPGLPSSGYGGPDGIVCPLLEKEATFRSFADPLRLTVTLRQVLVIIDQLFFVKELSGGQCCYRRRLGAGDVCWDGVLRFINDPCLCIDDSLFHPDITKFVSSIRNSGSTSSGSIEESCGSNFAEFLILTWVPGCDERPIVSSLMALDKRNIASDRANLVDMASSDSPMTGNLADFFSSLAASRMSIGVNELAPKSLLYRFLRDRFVRGPDYYQL